MVSIVKLSWSDLSLPPLNLWNFPKQHRDHMNYTEERRRANSLKLRPTRKPKKAQQPVIAPAYGVGHSMQTEQILNCIARRNGRCR